MGGVATSGLAGDFFNSIDPFRYLARLPCRVNGKKTPVPKLNLFGTLHKLPCARRKHTNEPIEVLCSANDNDVMDEFNADGIKATLDLFILKRFSDDGPLSFFEIQRGAKPIHTLLELFAVRRGKQSLGSVPAVLQRLHRDGWLTVEPKLDEDGQSALVYSLTILGEQRVKEESARLESMLSQFVEQDDMENSFRKFLDRRKPVGDN